MSYQTENELLINKDQPTSPKSFLDKEIFKLRLVNWIRLLVLVVAIALIIVGVVVFKIQHYIPKLLEFIDKLGFWGGFVFVAIYIVCTVCFIPGSLLTLGGGFIFKYWAILLVWLGATVGCILAFILGRTLLRSWVEQKVKGYPKFRAVDNAIKNQGFKIVLLLRLSPVLPFNLLNYSLALTNVSLPHYSLASAIGMIPGTCLYVYIGTLAGNLAEVAAGQVGPNFTVRIIIWVVSGVVIVATVVFVTIIARKEINKELSTNNTSEQTDN